MGATATGVRIRQFEAGDETAFRELNEAWIAQHFSIEAADRLVLEDPVGQVLGHGGHIYMAVDGQKRVGCSALLVHEPGIFEVAKMAVTENYQGQGIGRRLLAHTIADARALGAKGLYLETNTKLATAIHLYESLGFRHLPPERLAPSPYARANVFMEMTF